MRYTSGKLDIRATAVEPIHHGAGTSGNTQILRVQDVILPDGSEARVPFVSGNSLKHMVRDGMVRFALDSMAVPDGTLSKSVVDLLFSGGHLGKGKGAVDLSKVRRLSELFPVLSVCGYSAGNHMEASKLACDMLHFVCRENEWRLPADLEGHPHLRVRVAQFRKTEMGTRHESTRDPRVSRMLTAEAQKAIADDAAEGLKSKDKAERKDKTKTTQMIYDFQVIAPGSVWWGAVHFKDLTDYELAALKAGIAYSVTPICEGRFQMRLGAKGSVGFGRVNAEFGGFVRTVDCPSYTESTAICPVSRDALPPELGDYVAHLRANKAEIMQFLEEVAG